MGKQVADEINYNRKQGQCELCDKFYANLRQHERKVHQGQRSNPIEYEKKYAEKVKKLKSKKTRRCSYCTTPQTNVRRHEKLCIIRLEVAQSNHLKGVYRRNPVFDDASPLSVRNISKRFLRKSLIRAIKQQDDEALLNRMTSPEHRPQ